MCYKDVGWWWYKASDLFVSSLWCHVLCREVRLYIGVSSATFVPSSPFLVEGTCTTSSHTFPGNNTAQTYTVGTVLRHVNRAGRRVDIMTGRLGLEKGKRLGGMRLW